MCESFETALRNAAEAVQAVKDSEGLNQFGATGILLDALVTTEGVSGMQELLALITLNQGDYSEDESYIRVRDHALAISSDPQWRYRALLDQVPEAQHGQVAAALVTSLAHRLENQVLRETFADVFGTEEPQEATA